jgi:uncharacterized protein (TIGR02246 family)
MADSSQELRSAIEAQDKVFMDAFGRGDSAGIADLYAEGAVILPPNADAMGGKQAIQAFWQGAMDMGLKSAVLETTAVDGHGDVAVEIGRYTLAVAGGTQVDNGKYLVVWKQEGGSWKLYQDIWNSSKPASA